eukprot:s1918_g2.t2
MSLPKRRKLPWARHGESAGESAPLPAPCSPPGAASPEPCAAAEPAASSSGGRVAPESARPAAETSEAPGSARKAFEKPPATRMAPTGRTAADAEKVPEGGKASRGADGAGRTADGAAESQAAVVWEFSVKDGFKAFDKECQELVETLHRAFLAGGDRVGHDMKQRLEGGARERTATQRGIQVTGPLAVVTGANKGLGFHVARQLQDLQDFFGGEAGLRVIIACRNELLAQQAAATLGCEYEILDAWADLASDASIDAFAKQMETKYTQLDVLVNNAAIAFKAADPTPFKDQTDRLLPLLRASAMKGGRPKIVNVASMAGKLRQLSPPLQAQFASDTLDRNRLVSLVENFVAAVQSGRHKEMGWSNSNYGMSKLALIALTRLVAREEPTIQVNACCPGYCRTDMSSNRGGQDPSVGARTVALCALLPPGAPSGAFFENQQISVWSKMLNQKRLQRVTQQPKSRGKEAFQALAHAYEVLADDAKRQAYNASIVERRSCDGAAAAHDPKKPTCERHILAEHPEAFVKLLLSCKMAMWARLLKGLAGEQLQKLLDCLRFEENGEQKLCKTAEATVECSKDLPRPGHLHAMGNGFRAEVVLHGLCFYTPWTTSRTVAAYYHSAVVELKRCVQQNISANPFSSLEDAIIGGLADLDTKGLTCPLSFSLHIARFGHNFRSSTVDDIHVTLAMRQDAYNAASVKALKKLKDKWAQIAGDRAEKAQGLRQKTASRLAGYILAQQEARTEAPLARVRRSFKQPADVVVQVPFLGHWALTLGLGPVELRKRFSSLEGQQALKDFLARQPPALEDTKPTKLPRAVFGFIGLVDLCQVQVVNKECCDMAKERFKTRCHGTFTPSPEDFGNEWQHLIEFVNWGFLQETRVLDLRHLPAEAHSGFLWAVLCTLEKLERVLVTHAKKKRKTKKDEVQKETEVEAPNSDILAALNMDSAEALEQRELVRTVRGQGKRF